MESGGAEVIVFDHVFDGARHRCGYRILGDRIVVVVGDKERNAELDRMPPERLANILARELLIEAGFAKAKGTRDGSDFPGSGPSD